MAITFDTLKEFMPAIGLKQFDTHGEEARNGRIIAGFQFDTGETDYPTVKAGVVASLQEDGELIQLRLIRLIDEDQLGVKVKDNAHVAKLMEYLLKCNYENKIGRWCMDPADGEIYVDWAIPVEDNDKITVTQVKRLMRGLVAAVREAYAPIHRILLTGNPAVPMSRDTLIKDILLKLTESAEFALIPRVAGITDTKKLATILDLLNNNNIDAVKAELSGS